MYSASERYGNGHEHNINFDPERVTLVLRLITRSESINAVGVVISFSLVQIKASADIPAKLNEKSSMTVIHSMVGPREQINQLCARSISQRNRRHLQPLMALV